MEEDKGIPERISDALPVYWKIYPKALHLEGYILDGGLIDLLLTTYSRLFYRRDFEPARVAALCMIPPNIRDLIPNHDVLQGYVDVIGLYVGVCTAKATERKLTIEEAVFGSFPGLYKLPCSTQQNLVDFVNQNLRWADRVINNEEAFHGKGYMKQIFELLRGKDQKYLEGAEIARDTFLMHVEIVEDFQRGHFGL